jgi:multiple sugar transport system substrate-binding protein
MSLEGRRVTRRHVLRLAGAGLLAASTASLVTVAPAAAAPDLVPPFQQGGKITIQVNSGNGDAVRNVAKDYTARTNTQVEVIERPYDQAFQQLQIVLSQKTDAFDLASLDDPWIPQFAGGKFLASLDDLYTKTGSKPTGFQEQLLGLGTWPPGSGMRALPWLGNVQVFAWRSDLVSQRPTNWDDVVATAQQVGSDNPGIYGCAIRGAAGNPATTSFLPITRGYGKDVLAADFTPQLDTPEAHAALQTMLKLRDQAPPGVENTQHADVGRYMYTGQTAMSGDIWPDQLLNMFDPTLSSVVGKIEIGAEPSQAGVTPANMTGTWLMGIPLGSKNQDRAFDFLVWFSQPEQGKRLLVESNIPPVLTALFNDPAAVAKFPFLPGLLKAAQVAVPRPRTQYYSGVEDIIGRYLSEVIAGQVDPDTGLQQANQDVHDFLARNGVLT